MDRSEYDQKLQLYIGVLTLSMNRLVTVKRRLVLLEAFQRLKGHRASFHTNADDEESAEIESFVSFAIDDSKLSKPFK